MRPRFVEVVLALALAACSQKRTGGDAAHFEDCMLGAPTGSARVQARCTSFDGVQVALLPAEGGQRAADPLFFVPGGPGQGGFAAYAQVAGAFALVRRHRDIVVVEPRGTGASEPLVCKTTLPEDLRAPDALSRLKACAAELGDRPSGISTANAVRDIDMVRGAMGYARINVYAASYGTRVALQLVKAHPETVRALVLDGVIAPETSLGVDQAEATARALEAMELRHASSRHEGDVALGSRLATLGDELAQRPATVRVRHPSTGEPTSVVLDDRALTDTLRAMLYQSELVALVPKLIEAASNGDFDGLASQALLARGGIEEAVNPLVYLSVVCAEDVPFWRTPVPVAGLFAASTGDLASACKVWPVSAAGRDLKQPVATDVPMLLLSGAADPVTPPTEAEKVAAHATHARQLVLEGQGHISVVRGCAPRLLAGFIDAPQAAELDTRCAALTRPLPFFTGPNAP